MFRALLLDGQPPLIQLLLALLHRSLVGRQLTRHLIVPLIRVRQCPSRVLHAVPKLPGPTAQRRELCAVSRLLVIQFFQMLPLVLGRRFVTRDLLTIAGRAMFPFPNRLGNALQIGLDFQTAGLFGGQLGRGPRQLIAQPLELRFGLLQSRA